MSPWVALAVIVAVRISLGLQFQSVGSLGPFLVQELAMDFASLGMLIGIGQLPQAAMALPAGWLNSRFGDRILCVGGLAIMAVGAFILAAAPGFGIALAARLMTGVGSVCLGIVMTKLVFDRFTGTSIPVAMGFLMAAWPGGQWLGLAALPAIAQATGWRFAMATTGVFCAVGLVAMALLLRTDAHREAPQLARLMPGELAPLLAAAVVWTMLNAALNIFVGYGPTYFVSAGLEAAASGMLVSLLTLPLTFLLPLGGFLSRAFAHPARVVAVLIAAMAATGFAVPVSPWPAATMFLLGVLMGLPSAFMAAQSGSHLSPQSRAIGLGLSTTVLGIGTAGLPPVAGWAQDITQVAAAPLYVAATCLIVCAVAQIVLILLQFRRAAAA